MKVRLIPNSGIQYITLPDLDIEDLRRFTFSVELRLDGSQEESGAAGFRAAEVRASDRGRDDEDFYGDGDNEEFQSRSANPRAVVELAAAFNGIWLPLPFDRGGPWVAIHLRPGKEIGKPRAALAVDTTLDGHGNPHGCEVEVGEREVLPASRLFWRKLAVSDSIRAVVDRASRMPNLPPQKPLDLQMAIVGLAEYLRAKFDGGAGLGIVFAPRPERGQSVKVDLVLDLGNSRTCALLLEEQPSFRQERLELVYPDDPFSSHQCPFETQFALVQHEVIPTSFEPCDSFRFLSMIKMGPPAGALLRALPFDPQPVGMSSPKRYLWEMLEPVRWDWRRADAGGPSQRPPVVAGCLLRHMNPARPLAAPDAPELPAAPNYPRQACAVWCIVELLEQAFRQVNSPAWRRAATNAPMSDQRREIGSVVIMYPAGMHSEELRSYRAACETACRLWTMFRSDPQRFAEGEQFEPDASFGVQKPAVQVVCDEALAIQVCWLYGELVHRHRSNVAGFLRHLGRKRGSPGSEVDTLRVASLDIGGGTIDLAIADYTQDSKRPGDVALNCSRIFHDGVSRAGDEIVRSLLEEVVFPAIAEQCDVDRDRWNELFSRAEPGEATGFRRLLVRNVWMPIAMHCMAGSEAASSFEAVLGEIPMVDSTKLVELERLLGIDGGASGKLRNVVLRLDRRKMSTIIRVSLSRTITQCSDIVDQHQCDLLIVGGRPSSNPSIRQQILSSMAVPPGQVVFLAETRAGDWYPFIRKGGRIGDAKTCGVVGAALAFRAMYGFSNFRLTPTPTVEPEGIIGFVVHADPRRPLEFGKECELDLVKGHDLTVTPELGANAGLNLAIRRIADSNAEAKPIYQLRLKSRYKRLLERNPVHQDAVEVTLEYADAPAINTVVEVGQRLLLPIGTTRDVVRLRSVRGEIALGTGRREPAEKAMELVLKTMLEGEGYWIDTGQFGELKSGEPAMGGAL